MLLRFIGFVRRLAESKAPVAVGIDTRHLPIALQVGAITPRLAPHTVDLPGVDVTIGVHRDEQGEDEVLQQQLHVTLLSFAQQ